MAIELKASQCFKVWIHNVQIQPMFPAHQPISHHSEISVLHSCIFSYFPVYTCIPMLCLPGILFTNGPHKITFLFCFLYTLDWCLVLEISYLWTLSKDTLYFGQSISLPPPHEEKCVGVPFLSFSNLWYLRYFHSRCMCYYDKIYLCWIWTFNCLIGMNHVWKKQLIYHLCHLCGMQTSVQLWSFICTANIYLSINSFFCFHMTVVKWFLFSPENLCAGTLLLYDFRQLLLN